MKFFIWILGIGLTDPETEFSGLNRRGWRKCGDWAEIAQWMLRSLRKLDQRNSWRGGAKWLSIE